MPRLFIVSRSSHPRGGADRIIADLCRQLPAYGWDVTLGLTKGLRFNRPELYLSEYPGLPVIEIDGTAGSQSARVVAIESALAAKQPDIVLTMRVYDAYAAVDAICHRSPGYTPRFVVGIRAFEAPYLADLRRNSKMVDGCITSGKLIATACHAFGQLSTDRVFSIGGGVKSPVSLRNRSGVQTPMRLLYAGRLEQSQKRVHDLIPFVQELSARTDAFVLTIVGDGPEESLLRDQLQPWTLTGQVRFCGWQDQQSLYDTYYPEADIFLHFAAWEGVTIAPREAMAHGVVPVISQFTGQVAEGQFVHERNSLVFPVADTGQAVQHVVRLQNDHKLYSELSQHATTSQTGEYSAEGAIEKWDRSLRAILALPKASGCFQPPPQQQKDRRLSMFAKVKSSVRTILRKPLIHGDPGSEWPTSSGCVTAAELREIGSFSQHHDGAAGTIQNIALLPAAGRSEQQ